jgi:hypothetical protein
MWRLLRLLGLLLRFGRRLPVEQLGSGGANFTVADLTQVQEPRSLSGMDRIYAPQIQRDFPELNLSELKQRAQQLAVLTLRTIDAADLSLLGSVGELYHTQVAQGLAEQKRLAERERFSEITVHRIVLSRYEKSAGTCRITFQLAIGARYQKVAADGQVLAGQAGISQLKMEIEALYVQDRAQLTSREQAALAFNCPNCGAPVPSLGDRRCLYCGSAIEPVNIRVWTFCRFQISGS